MLIGLVKEIKNKECRVGLTPDGTKKLIEKGHHIYIEQQAGFGSGFSDQDYRQVGGIITSTEDARFSPSNKVLCSKILKLMAN